MGNGTICFGHMQNSIAIQGPSIVRIIGAWVAQGLLAAAFLAAGGKKGRGEKPLNDPGADDSDLGRALNGDAVLHMSETYRSVAHRGSLYF